MSALYGLLGHGISASPSPVMMKRAFQEYGIDADYIRVDIEPLDFDAVMKKVPVVSMDGFNVTIPFKERILGYMSELEEHADIIGAVNTVRRLKPGNASSGKEEEHPRFAGYNTDWAGFLESLSDHGIDARNKEVLVIGAGGAALAIWYSLLRLGVSRLLLMNRTVEKIRPKLKAIENRFSRYHSGGIRTGNVEYTTLRRLEKFETENISLVVSTLPQEHFESSLAIIGVECFNRNCAVYDIGYRPWPGGRPSILDRHPAGRSAFYFVDGRRMLARQGQKAFKIWTGIEPAIEILNTEIDSYLGKIKL